MSCFVLCLMLVYVWDLRRFLGACLIGDRDLDRLVEMYLNELATGGGDSAKAELEVAAVGYADGEMIVSQSRIRLPKAYI